MIKFFKDIYTSCKEVYDTDRKEFWDTILGGLIVIGFFLLLFYVINPIFTEGHSYLD
jgi:preprotein translocase subunit SecE